MLAFWPFYLYIVSVKSGENKRTLTLNLTPAEAEILEQLSSKKDLSKTAVIRQALRLYQAIEVRAARGEKLVFENESTKEKAELMLL